MIRTILALAVCLPGALAYLMYQTEIPNGDHVPHPCKPNFLWHGVGHENSQGGGDRNPFGKDFAAQGHKWTRELCAADSDGDGQTNGQELGDPDCVWSKGQTPPVTNNITHPGVCNPWHEVMCVSKNSWLNCAQDLEFNCPPINEPDVLNITMRFPRTKVPAKETTYICFNFQFPDDREYHLIATKPYIDNKNVMHHIVLSTCDIGTGLLDEPVDCLMGTGCGGGFGAWTLGQTGECITPEAGILVGKGHKSMLSMQHHWTNPGLVDEWFDSSGMVLYYTPKLRKYNAGFLSLGQLDLNIPPGKEAWVHKGVCTSDCTRRTFRGDIQVISLLNHMHYLGTRQNVTMSRPGRPLKTIVDDDPFRYDSPVTHVFNPPLTVRAGDSLDTHCTFQSRSRTETTRYGEGSFDEMCFALMAYYPVENLTQPDLFCGQWKDVDFCHGCNFTIVDSTHPYTITLLEKVLAHCDPAGQNCLPDCPRIIREVTEDDVCIKYNWEYIAYFVRQEYIGYDPKLAKLVSAMESCSRSDVTTKRPDVTWRPDPEGPKTTGMSDMLLNLVKAVGSRPLLQNIIMNVNYNNYYGAGYKSHDHDDSWH